MFDFSLPWDNTIILVSIISTDDHNRVELSETPANPGSDYINASYIDVSDFYLKKALDTGRNPVVCAFKASTPWRISLGVAFTFGIWYYWVVSYWIYF